MRQTISSAQRVLGPVAIVAGLVAGFFGFLALAQPGTGRAAEAAALIGVAVYSADGREVGTISAVTVEPDGEIGEIRLTTSSLLGLGGRTIAITYGSFVVLDGAVVLDLYAAEVDALPTSQPVKRVSTLA